MIFIFGDSHADYNFRGLSAPHMNLFKNSITMHRMGRDCQIINFNPMFNNIQNSFIFCFGEIDCRCHIGRQIAAGRDIAEICDRLVNAFGASIKMNIQIAHKIIICSITPAIRKDNYESVHGPVTHEFPFLGTDEERVIYTAEMNRRLEQLCQREGWNFLNVWPEYARSDGTLQYDRSDGLCHIKDNAFVLEATLKVVNDRN